METDGFFAASNSGKGFKSYYDEVFGGLGRLYIIKGGPGTGKSRFMKDVADYGAKHGFECEKYYCSSDPTSLDGIILSRNGERFGMIDGTAPHAYEAKTPGAVEQIIDLGGFWDMDALAAESEKIKDLNRRKSFAWRRAYSWLSGCLDMCEIVKSIGERCIQNDRIAATVEDLFDGVPMGDTFSMRTALIDSVGMMGQASSAEYITRAQRLFMIRDRLMSADTLLSEVLDECRRRRLHILISRHPIDADRLDGLFIEDNKWAFVVSESSPRRDFEIINMANFISDCDEVQLADAWRAGRCYDTLQRGAVEALAEVKKYHFELEEIYISRMDFDAKEKFTEEFCRKTFGE